MTGLRAKTVEKSYVLCMDKSLHDLVENYAENTPKLRHNCTEKCDNTTQNWPWREAPRPILRAACVTFFLAIAA